MKRRNFFRHFGVISLLGLVRRAPLCDQGAYRFSTGCHSHLNPSLQLHAIRWIYIYIMSALLSILAAPYTSRCAREQPILCCC